MKKYNQKYNQAVCGLGMSTNFYINACCFYTNDVKYINCFNFC